MNAAIPAALALATLACLWLVVVARGPWQAKAAMIVAAAALPFAVYLALDSYRGWPSTATPPPHAFYVAGAAVEPNPSTGARGAIYLWLVPASTRSLALGYAPSAQEPRAYRLPYSRQMQEQIANAPRQQRAGARLAVKLVRGHRRNGSRAPGRLRIYRLPPPHLPAKDGK